VLTIFLDLFFMVVFLLSNDSPQDAYNWWITRSTDVRNSLCVLDGHHVLVPALAAVQTLAFQESSAVRGAVLSLGYCLGLGLPFILSGLSLDKSAKLRSFIYRRGDMVSKVGGIFLITIGVLQVFGFLESDHELLARSLISDFIPVI